jgi:thiamine biosynthesis lipoprotein
MDFEAWSCAVRLVVSDPRRMDRARGILDAELEAIDRACSRFRDDSELQTVLRNGDRPATISPLLAEAIRVALRAARITDGDLDPTVGEAMSMIGYDRDFAAIPSSGRSMRLVVRPVPGWRCVHLKGRELTVPRGVQLDLGATAKALAADRAARRIAEEADTGVLVSIGGDIAVAGPPPNEGWPVRVASTDGSARGLAPHSTDGSARGLAPHSTDGSARGLAPHSTDGSARGLAPHSTVTVSIRDGGLATSSTTVRRWIRGDRVLHHILDPRTGCPANSRWQAVSVAAGSCVDANIASTTAVIRGAAAPGWLGQLRLPGRLVDHDGNVTTVAGWPT